MKRTSNRTYIELREIIDNILEETIKEHIEKGWIQYPWNVESFLATKLTLQKLPEKELLKLYRTTDNYIEPMICDMYEIYCENGLILNEDGIIELCLEDKDFDFTVEEAKKHINLKK